MTTTTKTTQNSKEKTMEDSPKKVTTLFTKLPSKSVRPQRSMVRVKSLRPKRLALGIRSKA